MSIDLIIKKLIPLPNSKEAVEFYDNKHIIEKLSIEERLLVENALIDLLMNSNEDLLIYKALSHLNSKKSLPFMYKALQSSITPLEKLKYIPLIFNINHDEGLIDVAISLFREVEKCEENRFYLDSLKRALGYLNSIATIKTYKVVDEFIDHYDSSVKYYANILSNEYR